VIYICVRATLDWQDEVAVARGLKPEFRPKLETWNETFTMPYHEVRHRLKRIAELNLSRVENAVCARLDEIPDGALVVPVDDDDWFAPDLARGLLAAYEPHILGYRWTDYTVEIGRPLEARLNSLWWWLRGNRPLTCGSNNYGFIKTPQHLPLVTSHGTASRYFDANPARIRRLSGRWSVRNRNPTSQTEMGWRQPHVTRAELIETFHTYLRLYARVRLPRAFRWAQPYVTMMADLMREIEVR
jgi:hypothetical protein